MYKHISEKYSISEELLEQLAKDGLLNPTAIRNSYIYIRYRELRKTMTREETIIEIRVEFPYIGYETVESIIGHQGKRWGKKNN